MYEKIETPKKSAKITEIGIERRGTRETRANYEVFTNH